MPTESSPTLFAFAPVEGRAVVAGFDGGAITSTPAHCCSERLNVLYDREPELFAAHIWTTMISIIGRRLVAQTEAQHQHGLSSSAASYLPDVTMPRRDHMLRPLPGGV